MDPPKIEPAHVALILGLPARKRVGGTIRAAGPNPFKYNSFTVADDVDDLEASLLK